MEWFRALRTCDCLRIPRTISAQDLSGSLTPFPLASLLVDIESREIRATMNLPRPRKVFDKAVGQSDRPKVSRSLATLV